MKHIFAISWPRVKSRKFGILYDFGDVEKSAKMNKTLSIPEVSDARLIRQKTIYYVIGFVVVSIALWKGIPSLIWYI